MARHPPQRLTPPPRRQRGVVLLALLAILVLALGSVLLVGLQTSAQSQLRSEQVTTLALNEARDALIGWAVGNPSFPGGMPFPDREESTNPNYDGTSDCTSVTGWPAGGRTPDVAFGRLPWLGQGANCQDATTLGGLVGDLRDGSGERLWYAVSANLLRVGNGTALVDPQVNWFDPFDLVASIPQLPFDWLTVRDAAGNVLSERVAFVVLAAGSPVYRADLGAGGRLQSRIAATGVPDPDEYLDRYTAGGVTSDNANADGIFIMAPDTDKNVDAGGTAEGFNDRLVYVTVDELLPLVARRVLRDVADTLADYANAQGAYPWPAPFGDTAEPVGPTEQLRYLKSIGGDTPGPPPYTQSTERFGWLAVHRPYLDDGTADEPFETPFAISWNLSGGVANDEGTVTAADLRDNTFDADTGTCRWRFAGYVDCESGTADVRPIVTGGFWNDAGGATCTAVGGCQRTVTLISPTSPVVFEGAWTPLPPTGTEPRLRDVAGTVNNGDATLSVQIQDEECDASANCAVTATGTFTVDITANGPIAATGIRYDMGVVDDVYAGDADALDLPEWYVSGGWHRMIALALSEGYSPGGAATCTPGVDCLELRTVDGAGVLVATDNSVPALLIFSGRVLSSGLDADGDGDQDDVDAGAVERYFEPATGGSSYDDANLDDYVGAESLSVLRALLEAEVFNDQIMVLAP